MTRITFRGDVAAETNISAPEHAKHWGERFVKAQSLASNQAAELSSMLGVEEEDPLGWFIANTDEWRERESRLRLLLEHNLGAVELYANRMKALAAEFHQAVRWETPYGPIVATPEGEIE
jgi:hypothetical protein